MAHTVLSPVLERCVELAAQWHDGTYRKGGWRAESIGGGDGVIARVPVVSHVVAVGLILMRAGWDETTVGAGFLHDVLEDRDQAGREMALDELTAIVGPEIASKVAGVSEVKKDGEGRYRKWRDRKIEYLSVLADGEDAHVAISLADKIHNLWTMNASLEQEIDIFAQSESRQALSAGPDEQVWFFKEILAISQSRRDPRLQQMRRELASELERFRLLIGHAD